MLSDCVKFYKSFFQFSSVLFSIIWNLSYFHLIKTCVFLYKYYSKLSKVNLNVFDISSEPILNLFSSSASKIASYTFFLFLSNICQNNSMYFTMRGLSVFCFDENISRCYSWLIYTGWKRHGHKLRDMNVFKWLISADFQLVTHTLRSWYLLHVFWKLKE